jgi:hypothetical protein
MAKKKMVLAKIEDLNVSRQQYKYHAVYDSVTLGFHLRVVI